MSASTTTVTSSYSVAKKKSQWKTIWIRFKKNKMALGGLIVFLLMAVIVLSADLWLDYEKGAMTMDIANAYQSPSAQHIFGTDQYGRDYFTRVVYGGRISMFVGIATVMVSLIFGGLIGATAAYYGGKVEFIYRGYFDGVDISMMIHSGKLAEGKTLSIGKGSNGCITKNITFKGVSSHAGGSPQSGRNALYAATCGLNAVNALRETFVDDQHIRFHPIITEAGLAVNAIPEKAKVESYVRGASFESIYEYNKKVNRALAASAAAIGCNVELDDHPGYFPLNNDPNLAKVMTEAMETISGPGTVIDDGTWSTGSTDMGDVSAIMPAIHPHCSGSIGIGHGKDYYVADKKLGCLYPAQCLVLTAAMLLSDDAAKAKQVIAESKPYFKSKEEYLAAIDKLTMDKDAVIYNDDDTITLDYCK